MATFLCGIIFYYEYKNQYPKLFDEDGYLSFTQADAKSDNIVDKVKWSKVDNSNEPIEFNISIALSEFYMAGDGDLSAQPLFNDPEFHGNNFLIEFV